MCRRAKTRRPASLSEYGVKARRIRSEFVHAASKFILTQKLEGQTYIYYKRLATTVSREVLRSFVMSIIENITIYDGRVQTIVFKNGLSHTFILK